MPFLNIKSGLFIIRLFFPTVSGQTGQALNFIGDTGQTGVAQRTCKNNFKHLLASSTNQT
jgi:hypothetical protein